MKNFMMIALLLASHTVAFGQEGREASAKVYLLNGDVREGIVYLPIKNDNSRFTFRSNDKKAKKEAIIADNVDYIVLTRGDNSAVMKRSQVYSYGMSKKTKLAKSKTWNIVTMACENFIAYILVYGIDVNREGDFMHIYTDIGHYYLQRSGEKYPTHVGYIYANKPVTTFGTDAKTRAKLLDLYYGSDPDYMAHFKGSEKIDHDELISFLEKTCK